MPKITSTIWPLKPHTEVKHIILKKYLNAWLPIITRWNKRIIYIDGFAGPGEYIGGKPGSPIIAIEAVSNHKINFKSEIIMIFIEAEEKRYKFLKGKIAKLKIHPKIRLEIYCAKFDEKLTEILNYINEQNRGLAPTFIFIDPFGFTGMPFSLIKRFMKNKSCEVLITFMYEEINRFIANKKNWDALTKLFGTDEWKKTLNGKLSASERSILLHNIYKKQLEKKASVKYVRSFKMINEQNKIDYFLFFGTNNIKGLQKIKEAMWNVDKDGVFQFSDSTYNPKQPTLLESKPNFYLLKKILLENFKGKKIKVKDLEKFIITETPFRETHYKTNILLKMEKSKPPEIRITGCKRRGGTFPPECTIELL